MLMIMTNIFEKSLLKHFKPVVEETNLIPINHVVSANKHPRIHQVLCITILYLRADSRRKTNLLQKMPAVAQTFDKSGIKD